MPDVLNSPLSQILAAHQQEIAAEWLGQILARGIDPRLNRTELQAQCQNLLRGLTRAMTDGATDVQATAFAPVRESLADLSRNRALNGFGPSETATFVFSLKSPLFARLRAAFPEDAGRLASETWALNELIDQLGLFTMETFQSSREEVILRQQAEISELSTPVVRLWQGILALPLIGTLDSARTQSVMENLLQAIVDEEAELAIIDITGVPTVDTLVAQHLLKTIAAARLMGADCIVSGIRPQIAQTMVHLGVDLNVVSKATLADAFALALRRSGRAVVPLRAATA